MILSTGQTLCYDEKGKIIPCPGTGQDGEYQIGLADIFRFEVKGDLVYDKLTGLYWTRNANLFEFPVSWEEAFDSVKAMNSQKFLGFSDWRLPNRRELLSLVYFQARDPVLPPYHPFEGVFHGWYWTSTTAVINPCYAWNVHFGGGRVFYSHKEEERMVWPVRGIFLLPRTGQVSCYNSAGLRIPCFGTGQDGELRFGIPWPEPRFEVHGGTVLDKLTGLVWTRRADLAPGEVTWREAFSVIADLNGRNFEGFSDWRLPNINELESLMDAEYHSPALPSDHPFENVKEFYWSSTTSYYDPEWAWALYLYKGAIGVGLKRLPNFYVWAVRGHIRVFLNLS